MTAFNIPPLDLSVVKTDPTLDFLASEICLTAASLADCPKNVPFECLVYELVTRQACAGRDTLMHSLVQDKHLFMNTRYTAAIYPKIAFEACLERSEGFIQDLLRTQIFIEKDAIAVLNKRGLLTLDFVKKMMENYKQVHTNSFLGFFVANNMLEQAKLIATENFYVNTQSVILDNLTEESWAIVPWLYGKHSAGGMETEPDLYLVEFLVRCLNRKDTMSQLMETWAKTSGMLEKLDRIMSKYLHTVNFPTVRYWKRQGLLDIPFFLNILIRVSLNEDSTNLLKCLVRNGVVLDFGEILLAAQGPTCVQVRAYAGKEWQTLKDAHTEGAALFACMHANFS